MMSTQQPQWGRIYATDTEALWVDPTGVYPPELTVVEEVFDAPDAERFLVFRFILDQCTYTNGVLSDNEFHPELEAWFARDLNDACECCGQNIEEVIKALCSDNPKLLAYGYNVLYSYHGLHEFDEYPYATDDDGALEALS